jgi:hypothetical protein
MKKIFSSFKNAVNWYFNALAATSAMCPSCMIPPIGVVYMDKVRRETFSNKHSKAA